MKALFAQRPHHFLWGTLLCSLGMVFGIGLLPAASAQTVIPPAEASSSASPGTLSAARTFTNPIVEQDAADPWVIWKDGYYYFTFTEGGHISIWKSRSLTQIDRGKKVTVWRPSEENRYRWNIWAPELHWLNGKWYIYYAADDREDANHRMFVLESTSDDAQGSYVEKGMLKPSGDRDDRWAIDGTILQHLDKMYMVWSGWPSETGGLQNLYIAEMENPWTLRGPRVLLSTPETVWEWKINEAPQILQRNGKIFVIYSGNGAWTPRYAVGMLQHTGGDILNRANWKKSLDPVFLSHVGPEGGVYGPGHCSFTRSPDGTQDWILFHARLRDGDGWPGRKTFAQPFTWNADGTPNFGRPIAAGVPLPVPSAEPVLEGTNSSASIAQPVPSSGQSGSWPPNSTRAMFRYERSDAAPGALTNIRINAERTAKALVQQEVFGNFIEHLGGVIYEGVWAQVLLNPNIERVEERQTTPPHWDLGGSASWATGGYLSSRSVRMGNANATLSQRVYLPVHRTRKYALSFFARSAGTGQITVSLRADNNVMGPTVVQTPLAVSGDNWQSHKIEWQITAPSLKKGQATQLVVTHTGGAAVDIDQFQLFPNDAVHGLDPDVLRAAKAWHIPLLRLSGNFSSGYRWRDGIGLRLMRPTRANPAWAGVEPNHFGTDDFLRFSQLIGAVPHIGVNAGNGTPEEAAAWVRYVNGSKFRVPIWEIGNELYGGWQIGHTDAKGNAERFVRFRAAMLEADPRIKIIATGKGDELLPEGLKRNREWNEAVLRAAEANGGKLPQWISIHPLVSLPGDLAGNSYAEQYESAMAHPAFVDNTLLPSLIQTIHDVQGPQARTRIAPTEWGIIIGGDRWWQSPNHDVMAGAIFNALTLNAFLRHSDWVTLANMTALMHGGGIKKPNGVVIVDPQYYTQQLYAMAQPRVPVETTWSGPGRDVPRRGFLPAVPNVPDVDVFSALNADRSKLHAFVVNRNLNAERPVRFNVNGFAARSVSATVLTASSAQAHNTWEKPDTVTPRPFALPKATGRGAWMVSLPPHSLVVFTFEANTR